MSILVTGGAGFIGSHLVEHLLAAGRERLVVIDNFNDYYDPQLKRNNAAAWAGNARITLIEEDFGNPDAVENTLLNNDVTAICHLAASPGVPASLRHPREYFQNNVVGTVTLLEAVRRHPAPRFLFASSSTVYGRGAAPPFVEAAPRGPPTAPSGATH